MGKYWTGKCTLLKYSRLGPKGIARITVEVTQQMKDDIEEEERPKVGTDNGGQESGQLGESSQASGSLDDDDDTIKGQNSPTQGQNELDLENLEYNFDAIYLDQSDFDSDPEKE